MNDTTWHMPISLDGDGDGDVAERDPSRGDPLAAGKRLFDRGETSAPELVELVRSPPATHVRHRRPATP